MGLSPILPVLLCLTDHDYYYVEFTVWDLLPYFHYYPVYWFMTGTSWSLLHGHCSHTSSTSLSTGSHLVLHGVYCIGIAPILPILVRLTGSRLVLRGVYYMGLGPILPVLLRLTASRLVLHRVYCMGLAPILPVLLCLTSSRLVPHGVCCMGLVPILPILLHLLVHD
jgi:hypothetical protein